MTIRSPRGDGRGWTSKPGVGFNYADVCFTYLEDAAVELALEGVVVLKDLGVKVDHRQAPVVLKRNEPKQTTECEYGPTCKQIGRFETSSARRGQAAHEV